MLWGLRSNIFETFRFTPRKISRWKNLFVFQRLMFLYQLVNLVLETCLIFSKTLKLSKTYFCLEFLVKFGSIEQRALWFPYSRLFFGIVFKKVLFLEFYKVNCGVNIGFWHISFRKMFKLLTCKGNHDFWDVMMRMSFIKKKDFVTWRSYQGKMSFLYCYCLFDGKKRCLFQE